ncbi:hypothetical protein Tco_0856200 [Tanacetum coccineum]
MIVFHNEDGNPARANIKQALGYLKDGDGDGNSQPHKGVKASANSDVMYSFTSAQDGDPLQDDVRLCLGDDLKKAQDHKKIENFIYGWKRWSSLEAYNVQIVSPKENDKTEVTYLPIDHPLLYLKMVPNMKKLRWWDMRDLGVTLLSCIAPDIEFIELKSEDKDRLISRILTKLFTTYPEAYDITLSIAPQMVEVSFFKLLCTTDDTEDMTFDVYALPCFGLVLFVTALFIHAL